VTDERWRDDLQVRASHRVWWEADALHGTGACWRQALEGLEGACVAFVDSGVANAWPGLAERLHTVMRETAPHLQLRAVETLPGGEVCKHGLHHAERVAKACFDLGVSRRGCVIAVGGGAALDAIGFGASMAHRGVPLVRVPTTTLSQDDSAMGVKCGVNAFGQKNALGAFGAPHAVICCERLLGTLSMQHWLGGFSEAVKIALLKDAGMLQQIEHAAAAIRERDMVAARPILRRSAQLHREHILRGGDPFEQGAGRPLDHGHWAAHRLEALSDWTVPHGQAVAIGIALDACIARELGLLAPAHAERIVAVLRALGLPVHHALLQPVQALMQGLEQFRQHLGGRLSIPLITEPGTFTEVHALPTAAIESALRRLMATA
jgi:3-dehydroquinate synthase